MKEAIFCSIISAKGVLSFMNVGSCSAQALGEVIRYAELTVDVKRAGVITYTIEVIAIWFDSIKEVNVVAPTLCHFTVKVECGEPPKISGVLAVGLGEASQGS